MSLLYYSHFAVKSHQAINISAPIDPNYWQLPSGNTIDRPKLMVVLTKLEGLYIRASYGQDPNGQARLSEVALDSAKEVPGNRSLTDQDIADQVMR